MKKALHSLALLPLVMVLTGCEEKPNPANQRAFDRAHEFITLRDVITKGEGQGGPCPSTGDTRVLVIPVEFTDYPAETIGTLYNSEVSGKLPVKHYKADGVTPAGSGRSKEDSLEDIRKVYFGKPEETTWHSLASYYREASYGKQRFNGLVAPWQSAFLNSSTYKPVSAKEFKDNGGTAVTLAQNLLSKFYEGAYTQFKDEQGHNMFKSGKEFLQYFDSDKDGCIDVVEMVYSAPFYASYTDEHGVEQPIDNEMFWAYCGGTGTDGDVNKPKLSKWAWQSYYTAVEGGTRDANGKWRPWTCEEISTGVAKVDGHTIIHETGHAMGNPDYYDYDYKTSPLGGVDMQDHNVGDHSSHSKNWWGWSTPTVVTGPTTVTVKNFTETGECIMVPYRGYYDSEHYKGDTFNTEYISIELYSPTGVNEQDAANPYMDAYPRCPQNVGVKVYHVDFRLGVIDYSSGSSKLTGITDTIVSTGSSVYVQHAFDNTGTRTVKDSKGNYQWMYEYLPNEKIHKTNASRVIQDSNMFHEGDTFGYDSYVDYKMHEYGNPKDLKFGYKFKIDKMTKDEVTITFYQA